MHGRTLALTVFPLIGISGIGQCRSSPHPLIPGVLDQPAALGAQRSSSLAKRPYDLRHAAVSTWLSSGVEPQVVAQRAGHSVAVLFRVYAKCLDGAAATANARIEATLREGR